MRHLLKINLCFFTILCCPALKGQQIENGLWNSGLAFSITPADSSSSMHCRLLKHIIKTNLYPGVAVVENEYTLIADSNFSGKFLLPDSPQVTQTMIGKIHPLASQNLILYLKKDQHTPIPYTRIKQGHNFILPFKKNDSLILISQQLVQTNQALMSNDGSIKENNSFGLVFNSQGWIGQGERKAYIHLKDKLNLISIYGVSPDKRVMGDLTHLEYHYDITSDSVLLIWFEGVAPDFRFDKKVLPYKEALLQEMKKFDEGSFQTEKFGIIEKNDFGTNKQNKLLAILYFIMFSVPWVILGVFILFLIFKKKKSISTS